MIEAIISLGLLTAWFASVMFTVIYLLEGSQTSLKAIFSVATFLFSAWLLSLVVDSNKSRTCLEYETTMIFNVATKTMEPVWSCKKYCERVKESNNE